MTRGGNPAGGISANAGDDEDRVIAVHVGGRLATRVAG
jgi:hypothetical protein